MIYNKNSYNNSTHDIPQVSNVVTCEQKMSDKHFNDSIPATNVVKLSETFNIEYVEYSTMLQLINCDNRKISFDDLTIVALLVLLLATQVFRLGSFLCFTLSITLFVIVTGLLVIVSVKRNVSKLFTPHRRVQVVFDFINDCIVDCHLESTTMLFTSLSFAVILIARALVGECKYEFDSNPALTTSPPIDSMVLCFMSNTLMHIYFKSVRKSVLIVTWIISMSTVFWCVMYFQNWALSWVLLYGVGFAIIQYQYDRMQMLTFLKSQNSLEEEKQKIKSLERHHVEREAIQSLLNEVTLKEEKMRFDLEITKLKAKNEIKLKELESNQLRCLMGNVGHDLMTPIHSIQLDLELLKDVNFETRNISCDFLSEHAENKRIDPMAIIDSLEVTCKFMTMSVIRCLEYATVISDVVLKPDLETFDIATVSLIPIKYVKNHMQVDDQDCIILHSLNDDISSTLISDKNWFIENLLCLLSNATKFSHDSNAPVDVKFELISDFETTQMDSKDDTTSKCTSDNDNDASIRFYENYRNKSRSLSNEGFYCKNASVPDFQQFASMPTMESQASLSKSKFHESPSRDRCGSDESTPSTPICGSPYISNHSSDTKKNSFIRKNFSEPDLSDYLLTGLVDQYNTTPILTQSVLKDHSIKVKQPRQMIRVSVADMGIGVTDEERENLFTPHKQVQRVTGGVGLGLFSLRKRAEALGGSCGVESRPDGLNGSVFWFSFPYCPGTPCPCSISSPHSVASITLNDIVDNSKIDSSIVSVSPILSCRPLRILVVDDSNSVLKITSRSLRARGHYVDVEENGSLALERLKRNYNLSEESYDLVLTDLQMPIMNGYEFVKQFRFFEDQVMSVGNKKDQPINCYDHKDKLLIVGMSANRNGSVKEDAITAGMNVFIPKPFIYEDFATAVRNFVHI